MQRPEAKDKLGLDFLKERRFVAQQLLKKRLRVQIKSEVTAFIHFWA